MKYITFFYEIDKKIWGDKMATNRYFATISILLAALCGVLAAVGSMFEVDMKADMVAGSVILLFGMNLTESLIATNNLWSGIGRSALLLIFFALSAVLGAVAAVVVTIIVVVYLLILLLSEIIFGHNGGRKKRYKLEDGTEVTEQKDLLGGPSSYRSNDGKSYRRIDGTDYVQEE